MELKNYPNQNCVLCIISVMAWTEQSGGVPERKSLQEEISERLEPIS